MADEVRFADTAAGAFPSRFARKEKPFEPYTKEKQFSFSLPLNKKMAQIIVLIFVQADEVRFELTVLLRGRRFSKPLP